MHPILFTLGSFQVHSYGALGAIGFLAVAALSLWRGAQLGLQRERVADVIFWTSVSALVGSRLLFVLQEPEMFHSLWDVVNIRSGGLVFYGALIVGFPTGMALIRYYKLPFLKTVDIFSTTLPLGHAFARVGCFMAGCCYGTPTDLPWGVTFPPDGGIAPTGIKLHPTQLYESAYLLVIFGFVNWIYARKRFDGECALLYLTLYAFCRTFNEFLRGDADRGYFLESVFGRWLTMSQGLSLIVAGAALVVFLWAARKYGRPVATISEGGPH